MNMQRDPVMRHPRRRQWLLAAAGTLAAAPAAMLAPTALAQTARRVTLLMAGSVRAQPELVQVFRNRLRELGLIEGRDLLLEIRELEGRFDQLPALMREIVRSNPAVIVTHGAVNHAAKAATATIPIVTAITADPVGEGLAASLARPGGNITGNSLMLGLSNEKTVEILHELVPKARRVALLANPTRVSYELSKRIFAAAAAKRRLTPVYAHATRPQDIPEAFASAVAQRSDMLVVAPQDTFTAEPQRVIDLAARHRLPAIYPVDSFVPAGGLVFYGYSNLWFMSNAAEFVDRILKGRKPAELPFEQPTRFELVVNQKTAKALGLKIPHTIMVRADRVIE